MELRLHITKLPEKRLHVISSSPGNKINNARIPCPNADGLMANDDSSETNRAHLGKVILSASSPDDEALVLGAKYFGFEFTNRIDTSAIIHTWDVTAPPGSGNTAPDANNGDGPPALRSGSGGGGEDGGGNADRAGTLAGGARGGGGGAAKGGGVDKPSVSRVSYEVRRRGGLRTLFSRFG